MDESLRTGSRIQKGGSRPEDQAPSSSASNARFVLFADILGFKNLVRDYNHSHLRVIYKHAVRALALAALFGGRERPEDGKPAVNVRLISDSVFLWTDGDTLSDFLRLLVASQLLLSKSLCGGLPMRAAMTWGSVDYWADASSDGRYGVESVFGRALVESYEAADEQEWAGGIILSPAIDRFEELALSGEVVSSGGSGLTRFDSFAECTGLAMRYPVPMKDGEREAYAIRWPTATRRAVRPSEISGAFKRFHPRAGDAAVDEADAVERKLENTRHFVDRAASIGGPGRFERSFSPKSV